MQRGLKMVALLARHDEIAGPLAGVLMQGVFFTGGQVDEHSWETAGAIAASQFSSRRRG
jgi:hypothetical protein